MGVSRLYRVGSPFNASELREVDSVQSFDVMYLAHLDHAPQRLNRHAHTSWEFIAVPFGTTIAAVTGVAATASTPNTDSTNSGNAYFPQPDSYIVTGIDADTGQESHASATVTATNDLGLKRNYNTISWSAHASVSGYQIYKAHNSGYFGFIGATEGLSFRDDNIDPNLTLGPPSGRDPFNAPNEYPSTVTFHEQRLWWARTRSNPNAAYSSRSADFENMDVSVPLRADDAISIRLVSQGVNQVNQLVSSTSLLALTSDGLFKVEGANEDYLSANPPPRMRQQPSRGSSRLEPIVVAGSVLYKPKNTAEVRIASYNFQVDGIKTDNVSIFSPHFFEGFDIVDWCWAEEPMSCILAARSDGQILCFTWEKDQEVWGWTNWPLAGGGKCTSICSVFENGESRVYAIIEREIAGVRRTFRERLASARWQGLSWECHLDCAATRVFDTPTAVIDQLWHLEGQEVAVLADGVEREGLVVAGGKVTLDFTCLVAHVGLPFDVAVETLPLSFQTPMGASQGRIQHPGKAIIQLVRSRAPTVGVRASKLYPLKGRGAPVPLNDEASLLTGLYPIATEPLNSLETTAVLRHRISPLTVSAIFLDVDASAS